MGIDWDALAIPKGTPRVIEKRAKRLSNEEAERECREEVWRRYGRKCPSNGTVIILMRGNLGAFREQFSQIGTVFYGLDELCEKPLLSKLPTSSASIPTNGSTLDVLRRLGADRLGEPA